MSRLDTLSLPLSRTTPIAQERCGNAGRSASRAGRPVNVGQIERTLSLLGGSAMVGLGLFQRRMSGLAMAAAGLLLARRGYTGHCDLYAALGLDAARETGAPDPATLYEKGVKIKDAITVLRPAQALYDSWRRFENHSHFMPNVESVRADGDDRSFWRIRGPGGTHWEYEARIINDEPGRLVAWQSTGNADVQHAGSVRFIDAPAGRGTEVHFNVEYLPPAGTVGRFGAKLLRLIGQAPHNDVREGLRNFKRLMETGELPTTDGQPRGRHC